jgi:hypothetical protein
MFAVEPECGEFTATVIALSRVAFGVLVGEHRSHGFKDGFADEVLGGDQFQTFVLTAGFVIDSSSNFRVNLMKRTGHPVGHALAPVGERIDYAVGLEEEKE